MNEPRGTLTVCGPDTPDTWHRGAPHTAFVLAGGGALGAMQAGMLHALYERGIVPDLLVGTSVGALNAAYVASRPPTVATARDLAAVWCDLRRKDVFPLRRGNAAAWPGRAPRPPGPRPRTAPSGHPPPADQPPGRRQHPAAPHRLGPAVRRGGPAIRRPSDRGRPRRRRHPRAAAACPPGRAAAHRRRRSQQHPDLPRHRARRRARLRTAHQRPRRPCPVPPAPQRPRRRSGALTRLLTARLQADLARYATTAEIITLPAANPQLIPLTCFTHARQLIAQALTAARTALAADRRLAAC